MKIDLSKLPQKTLIDLRAVGQHASRLSFEAYLVGGVVRDLLVKRKSSDWDIVVEGDALTLAKALATTHQAELTSYPQFGTATIEFVNGVVMDFATARSEVYPHPGALPVVKAGTIQEDLFRRDFTINALAIKLNPQNFAELVDFNNGFADLKAKEIRVLHDKSFVDDPTRILRAVRFAARLGFGIESDTLRLLKTALAQGAVATVKSPRYFAEFRKIFKEDCPVATLQKLAKLKGLHFIEPRLKPDWSMLARIKKNITGLQGDAFYQHRDWSSVYLLGLLSRLSREQCVDFEKKFHLTRSERMTLVGLKEFTAIERDLAVSKLKPSQVYELLDPVDLEIIYFIRVASSGNIVRRRIDEFLKKWRLVTLEMTGHDMSAFGVKPGRMMGALLHTVLLKKIDGQVKNRDQEVALAKSLLLTLIKE